MGKDLPRIGLLSAGVERILAKDFLQDFRFAALESRDPVRNSHTPLFHYYISTWWNYRIRSLQVQKKGKFMHMRHAPVFHRAPPCWKI